MQRVDILGVQAFISLAEHGSFQRAAVQLNITQTALSHRLAKLEADLGVRLIARTTRRMTLTAEGLTLLPRVKPQVDALAASLEESRARGAAVENRLIVGCLPTIAASWLPTIAAAFRKTRPGVTLKIIDASSTAIADLAEAGAVDLAITVQRAYSTKLDFRPVATEPFAVLCPLDHPLAKADTVDLADLAGVDLILNSLLREALGGHLARLNWTIEVENVATAVNLARGGLGLTIVPRLSLDLGHEPSLCAVPLRRPGIERTLGLLQPKGALLSPAGEAFSRLVVNHLKEGSPGPR